MQLEPGSAIPVSLAVAGRLGGVARRRDDNLAESRSPLQEAHWPKDMRMRVVTYGPLDAAFGAFGIGAAA
jgi:hypothetical protein